MANSRQCRNSLNSVVINDQVLEDPLLVMMEVLNHFQRLYFEDWEVRPFFTERMGNSIDEVMATSLIQKFTEDEVWEVIKSCDGNKAPGPDGFNLSCIKKGWSFMKTDILNFMEEFHTHCSLPKGFNSSFIALIPKSENPTKLSDFRPISLIGCMYKILSKVLASRLKKTITTVVGDVQSAFTGGKNIQDSILIANEIVDGWKKKKVRGIIIKLDFEKAFDNLIWVYLFRMMHMFGYPDKWIMWIEECLSSAWVSVLVNGFVLFWSVFCYVLVFVLFWSVFFGVWCRV
ncbi:hypothetical protein RHMOL_Rhmol09G0024200 [Rhododendron molle]|nr:hypothetical protein RHMOL_Rhmol09G0024200 [Rhododendron molle]